MSGGATAVVAHDGQSFGSHEGDVVVVLAFCNDDVGDEVRQRISRTQRQRSIANGIDSDEDSGTEVTDVVDDIDGKQGVQSVELSFVEQMSMKGNGLADRPSVFSCKHLELLLSGEVQPSGQMLVVDVSSSLGLRSASAVKLEAAGEWLAAGDALAMADAPAVGGPNNNVFVGDGCGPAVGHPADAFRADMGFGVGLLGDDDVGDVMTKRVAVTQFHSFGGVADVADDRQGLRRTRTRQRRCR
jgi:hypothetical protein